MEDIIGVWFWDMGKKESSGDSYGKGKGLHAGSKGKSKGLRYDPLTGSVRRGGSAIHRPSVLLSSE